MLVPFTKMHGLGNDFVVIDNRKSKFVFNKKQIVFLGDRHRGVGYDQLLVINPSNEYDFLLNIYDPDGSEAGGCGNGARCIAKFLYELEGSTKLNFTTRTRAWQTEVLEKDVFQVNMGIPRLSWQDIPLAHADDAQNLKLDLPFPELLNHTAFCVNVGNPHAVFFVNDLSTIDLKKLGPAIENHSMFPDRINVEFAQVLSPDSIRMRVWERGTGITQACGTGATATLIAAYKKGFSNNQATIFLDGGNLNVHWLIDNGKTGEVLMSGAATRVYESVIELD